jgi:hypothetical protein
MSVEERMKQENWIDQYVSNEGGDNEITEYVLMYRFETVCGSKDF